MYSEPLYEYIKPLSRQERLSIARRIMTEIETEVQSPERGYDNLKRILPNIERITLTDEDLSKVQLNGLLPE